jgi:site-specific DNA recombinase
MSGTRHDDSSPGPVGAQSIDTEQQGAPRALLYLRVSTKEQAEMGGQEEGFSIPAQREACRRKAEQLGAEVIDEFVDRGESARSANRPQLQRLLAYVAKFAVDYVIVHKVDRLARNRVDDVQINLAFKQAGAQLVSVTENIDETPSGILLHGIMSTIAEFYSRNLSQEIKTKTLKKVQAGGTPTLAPIGYLNVRKVIDGRELPSVEPDPERAPLVRWAFEAYSSGEYTLSQLTAELTRRGLTQRPTAARPERPLAANRVQQMLRRRYYLGYVLYRGMEYPGSHAPLVSPELFERVQQCLQANRTAGDRAFRRQHYLKGTVRCGRCQSRLLYFISRGNGGSYEYFRCAGHHSGRTSCELPHLPAHAVEAAVAWQYRDEQLSPELLDELRQELQEQLDSFIDRSAEERKRLATRVAQLKRDRYKWAEKAMNEIVPDDIAREKQRELSQQLAWAEQELGSHSVTEADLKQLLGATLRLAGNCFEAYAAATPTVRRRWNQAWFDHIDVDVVEGEPTVVEVTRTPVASAVHDDASTIAAAPRPRHQQRTGASTRDAGSNVIHLVYVSGRRSNSRSSSNLRLLVELRGFEPLTPSMPWKCSTN